MQIPDAELDVLATLWNRGPATTIEICERLGKRRVLSHASINTLLRRLADRGLVEVDKSENGRAFVFKAIKPAATRKQLMREFLGRVFDGCGVEMVSTFLKSSQPSQDELDQLQAMLDKFRIQNQSQRESDKHEPS